MRYLVTGGAGFVGSNLVYQLLEEGNQVTVLDNLSREHSRKNLNWLSQSFSSKKLTIVENDVTDPLVVEKHIKDVDIIYHLAGQVAVTTSVKNPVDDFETNTYGTLNVIEAARKSLKDPIVIFTSTNKVYGPMEHLKTMLKNERYDYELDIQGIVEDTPLDFYSPYGCSKGAADQYVHDYHRIYGLKTVVFRMSCIYGPRQFGTEDQGWVAHFIILAVLGHLLAIYGDGRQVRDILYINDLIKAFEMATDNIDKAAGKVYNIGGGRENTLSLLELIELIEEKIGNKLEVRFDDWRPGDQKVYISNSERAKKDFGWEPKVNKSEGLDRLFNWIVRNKGLFK